MLKQNTVGTIYIICMYEYIMYHNVNAQRPLIYPLSKKIMQDGYLGTTIYSNVIKYD